MLLACVIYWKLYDIDSEVIFCLPECYQNIQDSIEYCSILSFRTILKFFAVNMLIENTSSIDRKYPIVDQIKLKKSEKVLYI